MYANYVTTTSTTTTTIDCSNQQAYFYGGPQGYNYGQYGSISESTGSGSVSGPIQGVESFAESYAQCDEQTDAGAIINGALVASQSTDGFQCPSDVSADSGMHWGATSGAEYADGYSYVSGDFVYGWVDVVYKNNGC